MATLICWLLCFAQAHGIVHMTTIRRSERGKGRGGSGEESETPRVCWCFARGPPVPVVHLPRIRFQTFAHCRHAFKTSMTSFVS